MKQFILIPRSLPEVEQKAVERALGYMPWHLKIFKTFLSTSVLVLGIALVLYPAWPAFKYYFASSGGSEVVSTTYAQGDDSGNEVEENTPSVLPVGEPVDVVENKLIIPKIGVDIPLVGSADQKYGLERGAWVDPETSTPGEGSNTVIAAHRFKYMPPHSETFYLLDKMQVGDTFEVYWESKKYTYRVYSISTVSPFDISILEPTDNAEVTLYTCAPLFSTKERLVVKSAIVN